MYSEGQIRKQVFLRLLGSPVVIAPFLLGATACAAAWALDWPASVGWFACFAGALGSIGAYLTRLFLDNGRIAQTVIDELGDREQKAVQAALDQLDQRLVKADDDPRPETALRDLRALVRAFDEFANQPESLNAPAVLDVQSRVRQLFSSSVRSIEQTLQLGDTAKLLRMPEARKPILEQREKVIADILTGVRQLGDTLAALQRLGTTTPTHRELARVREELDQSLRVASRVEERLNTLLDHPEPETQSEPPPLRAASNQKGP